VNARGVLRARWRLVRNGLLGKGRRSRRGRGSQATAALILTIVSGALLYTVFAALFGSLAEFSDGAARATALLGLVIGAALVALVVFDLHYAVSTLFLDSDLELLRRAPLAPAELFALKLLDAFPRTSIMLVVVVLPAVIAFASAWPLPPWAWLLFPLQMAALWAIPLGIGTALSVAVVRRVPARRAREALGLLSSLLLTLLWLANAFLLPRVDDSSRIATVLTGGRGWAAWSPPHWMASAIGAAHAGRPWEALVPTSGLVFGAALAMFFGATVASRQLEAAMARVASGRPARRGAVRRRRGTEAEGVLAALLRRDARLFARDWTVVSDVLTAALLWTLLPLVTSPAFGELPADTVPRTMLVALSVALGYEIAARSAPFEREAVAWVRLAPLEPGRWVTAKALGAAAIAVPLVILAAVVLARAFPLPATAWPSILSIALSALGLALVVGIWNGVAFGDWAWTNPRAMLTTSGRIVATLLLLVQLAFWEAVAYWVAAWPAWAAFWLPVAIATAIGVAPFRLARRRIASMEWSG
jgi:hypothetical protein